MEIRNEHPKGYRILRTFCTTRFRMCKGTVLTVPNTGLRNCSFIAISQMPYPIPVTPKWSLWRAFARIRKMVTVTGNREHRSQERAAEFERLKLCATRLPGCKGVKGQAMNCKKNWVRARKLPVSRHFQNWLWLEIGFKWLPCPNPNRGLFLVAPRRHSPRVGNQSIG